MPETKREPFCKALSDEARVLFGFKDAHAEIKVKPAIGPEIAVPVPADKVAVVKKLFDEAYEWAVRPEEERRTGGGTREIELDPRARARWEFPDGRVELRVRPVRISPWIPIKITREELLAGKPVMDEVGAWAALAEDVRNLQGA